MLAICKLDDFFHLILFIKMIRGQHTDIEVVRSETWLMKSNFQISLKKRIAQSLKSHKLHEILVIRTWLTSGFLA
jgi:uncharacterized protein YehS (DUF1456 family)